MLADLTVIPYYDNPSSLPEGFPTESFCAQNPAGGTPDTIAFHIVNTGGAASGAFTMYILWTNATGVGGGVVQSIPMNGQETFFAGIPNECYTSDYSGTCQFTVWADALNEVAEANEFDNKVTSFCVSPAV